VLEQKATIGKLEYQFHQVAMYYPTFDQAHEAMAMWNGMGHEFAEDSATLRGSTRVRSEWKRSVTQARMFFNYTIMPMEFEVLHYSSGDHRYTQNKFDDDGRYTHTSTGEAPFLSHFSVYTENLEREAGELADVLGFGPYYKFTTEGHTNPRVKGKKRFTETIFDTRALIGADLKFIQKVAWDYQG
jgi:hypothetical protein